MRKFSVISLIALALGFAPAANAAAAGSIEMVSGGTGDESFTISPLDGFSSDTVVLGQQSARVGGLSFNSSLGSLIDGVASLTFAGDPFKVIYSVEGYGNQMVYSDAVTVTATAYVGSTVLGTPEVFNVDLSDSCGGADQPDVDRFCTTKQLLTAFSDTQSLVLPPNTSISAVNFVYQVTQSDEDCVENYYTGNVLTTTSACGSGGTSVVDTSNLADPGWSGSISIDYRYRAPEPGSLWLLGVAVVAVPLVRWRPRRL